MADELNKIKKTLETDPSKLPEFQRDLGAAMVQIDEIIAEKGRTEAEQYEKFEKVGKEVVELRQKCARLERIQAAPSPRLPYDCTAQRAIETPGFETRALKGSMDAGDAQVLELQRANDQIGFGVALYRHIKKDYNTPANVIAKDNFPETWKRVTERASGFRAAMDTAEATGGLEWLWTAYSARLQERIMLEMKVLAQFKDIVQMPTATYVSPKRGALQKAYMAVEQTGSTGQTAITGINVLTGSTTLTAKYSVGATWYSEQLEDASIANIEQSVIADHPLQHAYTWEEAILSGDTSGTHMDTDTTETTDLRKGIVGLRFIGLNSTGGDQKLDCGTFEDDKFYRIEAACGAYGMRRGSFWQTGLKGYFKMKRLMFAQGYIPAESLLMILKGVAPGAFDYFHGKPVVVSEYQREDLNATGMYELGATKACIMLVCPDAFQVGNFQELEVRVLDQLGALYLQNVVRSKLAKAFTAKIAYATYPIVGIAINVDIAS